ncbi:thioesterase family protein [Gulosibacter faecalis]|jgi:hypothetical protein|uniref:Thioesterase family protein n=1 Tax=Gulosibacter faecalis TaxID=272240 RepID=A0ABW5UTJ1_9MICO|nr:thioesterase family protein [Gulosibacter faecalis]
MTAATSYFVREGATRFRATEHVGGGWNPREQHIAPVIGLLAHVIETDHRERRGADTLPLTRMSCDILGVIPIDAVDVQVTVLRPGRTIELIEARVDHDGRTAAIARAWCAQTFDTADRALSPLPAIAPPDAHPEWAAADTWPGGFIASLEARRLPAERGRASAWVRTGIDLIANEPVSTTARVLGLIDVANGLTDPAPIDEVAFPNLDLTAHLFRTPEPGWLGFDTTATFGPTGAGLTHSILHDAAGPFGAMNQILTVRPMS